jgi:hypothetical protein
VFVNRLLEHNIGQTSFVHSGLPDCSSPIVSHPDGHPDILGVHGTGFFARKGNSVIFITARHCLTNGNDEALLEATSRLRIPYHLHGLKTSQNDFVQFDTVYSFSHELDEIPGVYVDFVVLTITVQPRTWQDKRLRSRAVKLPPTGNWLENFAHLAAALPGLVNHGNVQLVTIGYLQEGTLTEISEAGQISTQSAKAIGTLRRGVYPHTMTMADITWQSNLNGFSGSPVFFAYRSKDGIQCALAGILVTGGNRQGQFIRISEITASRFDPPLDFDIAI